jgi:hypothetical protein
MFARALVSYVIESDGERNHACLQCDAIGTCFAIDCADVYAEGSVNTEQGSP